jgi:hypothetical protein
MSKFIASYCVSWLVVFGRQQNDKSKDKQIEPLTLVLFDSFYMFRSSCKILKLEKFL